MIQLYTWATPNGKKVSIMLEELNFRMKFTPSTSPTAINSSPNIWRSIPTIKSLQSSILMDPAVSRLNCSSPGQF